MQLHKATLLNRIAKKVARPLSHIICNKYSINPFRKIDAYLNFLQGKGSGTGWDMKHEIAAAKAHIYRVNPILFDIGANVGDWSQSAMEAMPDAKIYMFEPSNHCQSIIRCKNIPNTVLIPGAVGENSGVADLYSSSDTDGSASLHQRGDSYFADRDYSRTEVKVNSIDEIIMSEKISFIDFMKLDIEGHELFAFKGATNAFKERRIGAVAFEFGSGNINSHTFFRDFWNLFSKAGFRIWRVTPSGKLIMIDSYYEDLEYYRGVSNYIAELIQHPYINNS